MLLLIKNWRLNIGSCSAVLFLMLISLYGKAQNSPYSRYGLGDVSNTQNVANKAMGGVAEAYGDGQTINFINPASYADLQLTTLSLGINGGTSQIRDREDNTYRSNSGSLSY